METQASGGVIEPSGGGQGQVQMHAVSCLYQWHLRMSELIDQKSFLPWPIICPVPSVLLLWATNHKMNLPARGEESCFGGIHHPC